MRDRQPERDIHELMSKQHGVAATTQVRRSLHWRQQQSLVDARIWRRDGPRVVTSRAAPPTWQQQVMIATLATRGVASHATAARLHGFDGFDRCIEVHVALRYDQRRHSHPGAVIHVSRVLDRADQLLVHGIPSVIVPVCLLQIAERSPHDMVRALEGALRDGVSPIWIRQVADRYARPGQSASRLVVQAVDERVDGTLPRSWFQRIASRLLADAGIETVDEHPVHDGRRLLAQLDLAIPDLLIGIECQSWQWHATPAAQRNDAARKRTLRRLGWEIVDVWWSDLERIDDVVATVRFLIDERRS